MVWLKAFFLCKLHSIRQYLPVFLCIYLVFRNTVFDRRKIFSITSLLHFAAQHFHLKTFSSVQVINFSTSFIMKTLMHIHKQRHKNCAEKSTLSCSLCKNSKTRCSRNFSKNDMLAVFVSLIQDRFGLWTRLMAWRLWILLLEGNKQIYLMPSVWYVPKIWTGVRRLKGAIRFVACLYEIELCFWTSRKFLFLRKTKLNNSFLFHEKKKVRVDLNSYVQCKLLLLSHWNWMWCKWRCDRRCSHVQIYAYFWAPRSMVNVNTSV